MDTTCRVLVLASDLNLPNDNNRVFGLVRIVGIGLGKFKRMESDLDVKRISNDLRGISFICQLLLLCAEM
jgi:hypothetical protein